MTPSKEILRRGGKGQGEEINPVGRPDNESMKQKALMKHLKVVRRRWTADDEGRRGAGSQDN